MVLNLALRFLLEICVLMALGYWGLQTGKGIFFKLLLGIGAPVLVAIIWGTFGSPKAAIPVDGVLHFMLELGIFSLAVITLYATGRTQLAYVFAILIIINQILLSVFHQR